MSAPLSRCLLLVVLGGLHVSLLDVLPLALPDLLAWIARILCAAPTPRLMLSQMRSEPVSKALSSLSISMFLHVQPRFATYSCMPKAAAKTVPRRVTLLLMMVLRLMVSIVRS